MLVLTRKTDEAIDINGGCAAGGITISVVNIRGNRVKLGFDAPPEFQITRGEITEVIGRIHSEVKELAT